MKITTIATACLALACCVWVAPLRGQQVEPLLQRLESPFAAERERATQELIGIPVETSELIRVFDSVSSRVRLSLARVIAATGRGEDQQAVLAVCQEEEDRLVAEELEIALLTIACRHECSLPPSALRESATRRFLEAQLERLDQSGVGWSDDRELGRLFWAGSPGAKVLAEFLKDEDRSGNQRGLAAMILGRMVDSSEWVGEEGPSPTFRGLLKAGDENLKAALFYGAAAAGIQAPKFLSWVANHAVDEAMGPSVIEACLYFLYTQDDAVLKAAGPSVTRCALEYTDGYPESIHYNAAVLLKRIATPKVVSKRITQLKDSSVFSNFFLFDAILSGLSEGAAREDLIQWGLSHTVPQIRASAVLRWASAHEDQMPSGLDRVALVESLAASVAKTRSSEEDADCYAQRAGVASLAALGGQRAESVLRRLLSHSNEAVRMAAAMAIGDHGLKNLESDLVERLAEEGEFAVFGAAYALKKMGVAAAKPAFVRLLRSGNFVLMRPSLVNLRSIEGKHRVNSIPSTQGAWRVRARVWSLPPQ